MAKANNLAYDYSVYEPAHKQQEQRKIQVKKTSPTNSISTFSIVFISVIALFLLGLVLNGKVAISQTFNQATELNKQLAVLESDGVRLKTEIESKTTIKNVEDYAENVLGLKKLDKTQKKYVEIQKENVIKVVEGKSSNPFVAVKNWFSDALEYIGV